MEHGKAQESTVNDRRTRSLGRFNLHTGEVIIPSWNKRTKEQKRASTYGWHDGKHTREAQRKHNGTGSTEAQAEDRAEKIEG